MNTLYTTAPNPTSNNPNENNFNVVIEGYLYKKGESWGSIWKRRYFVLDAAKNSIDYYHYDHNWKRKPSLGSIPLPANDVKQSAQPSSEPPNAQKHFYYYFEIETPKRTFWLCAETKEDGQRWVHILRSFISPQQPVQQFSTPQQPIQQSSVSQQAIQYQTQQFSPSSAGQILQARENLNIYSHPLFQSSRYAAFLEYESRLRGQEKQDRKVFVQAQLPNFKKLADKEFDEFRRAEIGLDSYLLFLSGIISLLLGTDPVLQNATDTSLEMRRLICTYLLLQNLFAEIQTSLLSCSHLLPTSSSSTPTPVFEIGPYMNQLINTVRERILSGKIVDAPTMITKIDTWAKGKCGGGGSLLLFPDPESTCKWALASLYFVQTRLVWATTETEIHYAISQSIDQLISTLEKMTTNHFTNVLYSDVVTKEPKFSSNGKSLLYLQLVYGRLQLENSEYEFPANSDTAITNALLSVGNEISELLKELQYPHVIPTVKSLTLSMLKSWPSSSPLLVLYLSPLSNTISNSAITFQNSRWLKRMEVASDSYYATNTQKNKLKKLLQSCMSLLDVRVSPLYQTREIGRDKVIEGLCQQIKEAIEKGSPPTIDLANLHIGPSSTSMYPSMPNG